MKQRKASAGEQTIGSPRTLKLVLISIGHPVCSLKAVSKDQNSGFVSRSTVCNLEE